MKIVSACLAGINCKWSGDSNSCQEVVELVEKGEVIPVCPEQLGGLSTPRNKAERMGDKVITKEGKDVTSEFQKGAQEAMKIAKLAGCDEAILKAKSPSCGVGRIYDGTFSKNLIDGDGIFAEMLKMNDIKVFTEEDLNG